MLNMEKSGIVRIIIYGIKSFTAKGIFTRSLKKLLEFHMLNTPGKFMFIMNALCVV